MTELEEAIYRACTAFIKHYEVTPEKSSTPTQKAQHKDIEYVNGIPRCVRHDKIMTLRKGSWGDFYSCGTHEDDPNYANRSGYCKNSVKQ